MTGLFKTYFGGQVQEKTQHQISEFYSTMFGVRFELSRGNFSRDGIPATIQAVSGTRDKAEPTHRTTEVCLAVPEPSWFTNLRAFIVLSAMMSGVCF